MKDEIQLCCHAVLFDMDGVLVDSTHAVARVWRQWASERGFDPMPCGTPRLKPGSRRVWPKGRKAPAQESL